MNIRIQDALHENLLPNTRYSGSNYVTYCMSNVRPCTPYGVFSSILTLDHFFDYVSDTLLMNKTFTEICRFLSNYNDEGKGFADLLLKRILVAMPHSASLVFPI